METSDKINCPHCNHIIMKESITCGYCGEPIKGESSEEKLTLDGCTKSLNGCAASLFQFGCAMTLLWLLLSLLFGGLLFFK